MKRKNKKLSEPTSQTKVPQTPEAKVPQRWDLAPKRVVAAQVLVNDRNDLIGRFFLGVALAYNDLKGLVLFEQYLTAMGKPRPDFTPYFGQWHGVNTQIHRWVCGVLHELMNVIGAKQYKSVLNGAELANLVSRIAVENETAWKLLVSVATAQPNKGGLSLVLTRVRNDTSFHYNYKGRSLADAYLELFGREAVSAPNGANVAPQFSIGDDMNGTRFYYADAAAQHVMTAIFRDTKTTIEDVFNFGSQVNIAIVTLLHAFIASRQASS